MENKSAMTQYLQNIIDVISKNIESLENDKIKYGKFMQYVKGINKNLEQRRKDLNYYVTLLEEYKNRGFAE